MPCDGDGPDATDTESCKGLVKPVHIAFVPATDTAFVPATVSVVNPQPCDGDGQDGAHTESLEGDGQDAAHPEPQDNCREALVSVDLLRLDKTPARPYL